MSARQTRQYAGKSCEASQWPRSDVAFFIGEFAGTQVTLVNAANRADDTHGQLRRTHFHGKYCHRQTFVQRHVLGQC